MRIAEGRILDDAGRSLILRGVNLGGGSKSPFGLPGWPLTAESLENPENASFVGRPFPIEEAETHFDRLEKAGFTFLRLVITWEALEHSGPGLYDEAYLAYLRKILQTAEQKGITVFIDPHQDVWSRWTGGDGAPAWTLEKLGMDLKKLDECGAAITRQRYGELHNNAAYPRMIWPSNYNRYAAATMFSLFFGGNAFAPSVTIDGENVQDWLQNHYIAAFRHCYRRLKNCAAVAGWGIMNEPHNGFIGHKNLDQVAGPVVPVGPQPSPWDCIRAAAGYPVEIAIYNITGGKKRQTETLNPGRQKLFKDGCSCPWKQAGIWTDESGEPRLLKNEHFSTANGNTAAFMEQFHKPFTLRFIEKMKEANENTVFFIEGMPSGTKEAAHPRWNKNDPPNTVNAFHWYDGFALFTKNFRPWFTVDTEKAKLILGRKKAVAHFAKSLAKGSQWAQEHMNGIPSLLGEFGLAFDMNNRAAFKNGNYSLHAKALTMYYDAVDANLLHTTLWNYTADNTNQYGDSWNDEDLSIFSEGKERAAAGWKRPYPMATAGKLLYSNWNHRKGIFHCRFMADSGINAPTIIYLPAEWFGEKTVVSAPLRFTFDQNAQRLFVYNDGRGGEIAIIVTA